MGNLVLGRGFAAALFLLPFGVGVGLVEALFVGNLILGLGFASALLLLPFGVGVGLVEELFLGPALWALQSFVSHIDTVPSLGLGVVVLLSGLGVVLFLLLEALGGLLPSPVKSLGSPVNFSFLCKTFGLLSRSLPFIAKRRLVKVEEWLHVPR